MTTPLRTPYDGSSRLFAIGLKPLDLTDWIDADEHLAEDLAEKHRLAQSRWDDVFAAEPGTEEAQAEVLDLLVAYLPGRYPSLFRRDGDAVEIIPTGRRVPIEAAPALWTAAQLVQEDLVLMRRAEDGWQLAAASLSFPSSWRLREKFGRPIHQIHAPVPGFGEGSRNAGLVARMFDNMRPETAMIRWNWSVYGDGALHHPSDSPPRRFGPGERAESIFLRVERQTLRRLPLSGDILFTIRIAVDPLAVLERHTDGSRIAAAMIEQLLALDDAQLAYKGLSLERDRLVARLAELKPGAGE
jgi:hypothetical protein